MTDREKVIKGLNHCFHGQECCGDTECPYYIEHLSDSCCLEDCQENLKADVVALLKEQDVGMIVITTMDALPDYCYDCPCHNGEYGVCEADKEKRLTFEYRPYWCPLKEVNNDA